MKPEEGKYVFLYVVRAIQCNFSQENVAFVFLISTFFQHHPEHNKTFETPSKQVTSIT